MRMLLVGVILSQGCYTFGADFSKFSKIYKSLKIASYSLDPNKNVQAILALDNQQDFKNKLKKLQGTIQGCEKSLACEMSHLEVNRLQKRLRLAKKLKAENIKHYSQLKKDSNLNKEFYKNIVFEWTNDPQFSFESVQAFQTAEILKIRKKLAGLGKVTTSVLKDEKETEDYLNQITRKVRVNTKKIFTQRDVPQFLIKRNVNKEAQNVPGYYDLTTQTFFYTLIKNQTAKGDLDWLYLHEAIPGHHMQSVLDKKSLARQLFSRNQVYYDFAEGWGAYVETYGEQLGIYQSIQAKRKALEWDLLRSVRVLIDIGLHRQGWGQERAMNFWKKTAPEVQNLASREISRMQRWPGQVISYEYGKMKIIQARDLYLKSGHTLLQFHEKVLGLGQMPTYLLPQYIQS